jgi:predicted Zn-dependent protease
MRASVLSLFLCCVVLTSGCASTALVPVTDSGFTALESDEKGLWKRAEEQTKRINESGYLYSDRELDEYVNAVAKKLQPVQVYALIPFRVRVLKDPHHSAFALPNGAVYLHTGILASMENEAQLAALLGHEMTHVTNRHGVKKLRDSKSTAAVMATVIVATGGLGAVFGPVASASVSGYSRDMEREADREGFMLMEQAGYDPSESVGLFEQIKREIEEDKIEESTYFGSHPRIVERIESYRELIADWKESEQPRVKNADVFQAHVKKLVLDNAQLDMQLGRYERAASDLKRYTDRYPGEAGAYYLLGETNRKQGDKDHDKKAMEYYQKALSLDPGHFDSHKMLGIMSYKAGDRASAKGYLEKYLALNAKASDRAYIEGYIRACDQSITPK